MLILAHPGLPPQPHDLWAAWNLDPLLIAGLGAAAWAYRRGMRPGLDRRRARWFWVGIGAVAVALVSPLEPLSGALASAHMVQHLLLVLVAGPALALAAPGATLTRGAPMPIRRSLGSVRRAGRPWMARMRWLRHPATAWVLHVSTLWAWHAAVPYDAALRSEPVHVLEHLMFLGTSLLVWWSILGPARARPVARGAGVLLVFGLALQSTFLSVLLTFSETAWYLGYAETTEAWGLSALADHQLAGVLMWVPGGLVHLVMGMALLVGWLKEADAQPALDSGPSGPGLDPVSE